MNPMTAEQILVAVQQVYANLKNLDLKEEDWKEIQDLQAELTTLEERVETGRLSIALVGSTNSGKSALMNAILGEKKAVVSSRTDTTTQQQLEFWTLGSCTLIDTPGIEAVHGKQSQDIANLYADSSDLLLFVTGNEGFKEGPRQFLEQIVAQGKPVILVVNKFDLIRGSDKAEFLEDVRRRTCPPLSPQDIVTSVADPLHPEVTKVQIDDLIARILDLLKTSGKDILFANIVGRLHKVKEELKERLQEIQGAKADKYIRLSVYGAGTAAVQPLPVLDYLGITAIQAKMTYDLARLYGYSISWDRAKELVGIMAAGGGLRIFASLLKAIPGVGTYGGIAIQTSVAASGTFAMGHALKAFYGGGMLLSPDELAAQAQAWYKRGEQESKKLALKEKK